MSTNSSENLLSGAVNLKYLKVVSNNYSRFRRTGKSLGRTSDFVAVGIPR